jgi:hypothetical protein
MSVGKHDLCMDAYCAVGHLSREQLFDRFRLAAERIASLNDVAFAYVNYDYDNSPEDEDSLRDLTEEAASAARQRFARDQTRILDWVTGDVSDDISAGLIVTIDLATEVKGATRLYVQSNRPEVVAAAAPQLHTWSLAVLGALDQVSPVHYAIVTRMRRSITPYFYFAHMSTTRMTFEESLSLVMWDENNSQHLERVRGVYWGNLLGPTILAQVPDVAALVRFLSEQVGPQNVTRLRDGRIFFSTHFRQTRAREEITQHLSALGLMPQPTEQMHKTARLLMN